MNINKQERDKLRELAGKATQGPWEATRQTNDDCYHVGYFIEAAGGKTISDDGTAPDDEDAQFIAAANPSTILALLDMIDRPAASGDVQDPFVPAGYVNETDFLRQQLKDARTAIEAYKAASAKRAPAKPEAYMFDVQVKRLGQRRQFAAIDYTLDADETLVSKTPLFYDAEHAPVVGLPAQVVVKTHAGAHSTTVAVDLNDGEHSIRIYQRDHAANGETVGVADLPENLLAAATHHPQAGSPLAAQAEKITMLTDDEIIAHWLEFDSWPNDNGGQNVLYFARALLAAAAEIGKEMP